MENIIWVSIELAFSAIYTILTFLFVLTFLKGRRNIHVAPKVFLLIIVCLIKYFVSTMFEENTIAFTSESLLSAFLIGIVFCKVRIHAALISAFFATLAGVVSELTTGFLVTRFQEVPLGEVMRFSIYRLQGRTMTALVMLVIIMLVKRFRKGSIKAMSANVMLALCIVPIISAVVAQQFAIHVIGSPYTPTINDVIPLVSIAILNIFIFIFVEYIMRHNEVSQKIIIAETQNEAHQSHINLLTHNQMQIRTMTHDFKQQVHELYTLCEENRLEELRSKLLDLSNRESDTLLVNTENIMLDSILTSKIELADKQSINFKRKFDVAPDLDYLDSEICVLLGNALDNAIEACMRSTCERFIGMELTATPKQFLCHITNTIGTEPQSDGEYLKTSKKDGLYHGIGLQSMKRICEDLGGSLSFSYNDSRFNLWIEVSVSM
ncbi:MAG: GHKL domain-containing protein [Oscillospiraceae bacterium]|nr:GHKL domain-containing protein [Oscillospiraceae bacterium]